MPSFIMEPTSFILGKFFTACSSGAVGHSIDDDRRAKGFTWVLCESHDNSQNMYDAKFNGFPLKG